MAVSHASAHVAARRDLLLLLPLFFLPSALLATPTTH